MPVRNASATLPAVLASLAAAADALHAQTHFACELLALDHGSTDSTAIQLRAVADKDTYAHMRISVLSLPGPEEVSFARVLNGGLERARGRFIARMDADDVCHPERLRRQTEHLLANASVDVAGCRVAYGGDRAAQAGYARYVDWINSLLSHDDMALARFRESPLAHPSVMFRRELVGQHGGYREGPFPEDYELWLRWFEAGVRFAKLPDTLLTWNDPPGRLSRVHPNYAPENFYAIKADYLARWLARHNPHHPDILVVGAGRVTRRRVEKLIEKGIRVKAWADLDPGKIGRVHHGAPVIHHHDIPPPGAAFVVPFVSAIGAPEHIRALLESRGHVRGRDFIEAA